MAEFPIIGRRFGSQAWASYVSSLTLTEEFRPKFVVVHNTSSPTLAQRPVGFTAQHMENLREYYGGLGWKGGPHAFVDDNGIWAFNPLNRAGRHSPSWNRLSWGVEMLGEFDDESFSSGRGAKVGDNAVRAVAVLCSKIGVPASTLRFHNEDPLTDHKHCPGKNVVKADFVARVEAILSAPLSYDLFYAGNRVGFAIGQPEDANQAYTPARPLLNAVFGRMKAEAFLDFDLSTHRLLWDRAAIPAPVIVRAPGVAWVAVRPFAEWARLTTEATADPSMEIRLTPGA